jgi:RecJ-like exonuclease
VYSDVSRIFRFVSTINNRVTELGDITVQTLDTDAIDTVSKNKLLQLFSTVIQVREDDGKTLFRVRGETETTWAEYPSRGETR